MKLLSTLSKILFASKPLEVAAGKLSAHEDTTIGVPLSARPFLVAATFADTPRPMLVVVAGEQAAHFFAHDVAVWTGHEHVLRFPERSDRPWSERPLTDEDIHIIGQRARALDACESGEPCIVIASARALLRTIPPILQHKPDRPPFAPLTFVAGKEMTQPAYDGLGAWLTQHGYTRLETRDGVGTFSQRGDVLNLYPSTLSYPVRIEFFGDEVECIRRIVPATGQTIGTLSELKVYPARELVYDANAYAHAERIIHTLAGPAAAALPRGVKQHLGFLKEGIPFRAAERYLPYLFAKSMTPIDYLTSASLLVLIEPRSLFDDVARAYDEIQASADLARTSPEGLYRAPAALDFGTQQRLTLLSLLTGGAGLDARLEVKHIDVSGSEEKLTTSVQALLASKHHTVLGIADRRAREDILFSLSDAHIPFSVWNEDAAAESVRADFVASEDFAEQMPSGGLSGSEDCLSERGERVPQLKVCSLSNGLPRVASDARNDVGEIRVKGKGSNASYAGTSMFEQATLVPFTPPALSPKILTVADIDIPSPISLPDAKIALLALSDRAARRAAARGYKGNAADRRAAIDPTALTFPYQPGDYVVHETHGIALFKALVRREVAGVERDYLHLEYAKGDKLFTPVEQIDRITRYVGPESKAPRLTRLNTSDWTRATTKARKAARQLAFDLVDLYARRSATQGFAYLPDDEIQYAMEQLFLYEETPDQLAAIADVKADMESRKPMDRLICGDVGFGKTEVALRAAFKAAQNSKQVMLLCPTTILAQQHYTTFSERFERFGVEVDVLSRFRTPAQQQVILERFATGRLDVLIGTHRLLSADVNPRDLGLIIIDEEQRFGVQHKEQLKNLREQVDVLTLSATPIPRTMNMAISGVRDLSLIDTPPRSRTPVKVHVGEWNEDVVSAAIRRELERGGQVYYVSNRVKDLDAATARVASVAPEARVALAHGKMSPAQLETVMERFAANEFDILIATTIIESGLDNPHTNTLIIEDSQRLGLAQLYQLKGRVGRSHAQAFAYFLFPSHEALTPEAIERLTAIDEFQELGSGTKIAMRDLEIRGAGSLLGAEQHGMLSAVGFDLFAAMLHEAVEASSSGRTAELDRTRAGKGDRMQTGESDSRQAGAGSVDEDDTGAPAHPDVRIDIPVAFFLPEEYVPAVDERVLFYRRIAAAADTPTVDALEEKLKDHYGALPLPARNLLDRSRVKAHASELGINHIARVRGKLNLEPLKLSPAQRYWAKQHGGTYFPQTHKLLFPLKEGENTLATLVALLESLLKTATKD